MTTIAHTLPSTDHPTPEWLPIAEHQSHFPAERDPAHDLATSGVCPAPSARTSREPDIAPVMNGWAGRLLSSDANVLGWTTETLRFGTGLGLAAVYGVALGARTGGASLFVHALGTPAALLAVGAVGVPAFAIVLGLMNAPIDGTRLLGVTARAVATSGLVLAGLAPAALLFALTSSTQDAAAGTAALGLTLAGGLGLVKLLAGLQRAIASADSATRLLALLASLGFGLFAIALAARVWSSMLPALAAGGGAW